MRPGHLKYNSRKWASTGVKITNDKKCTKIANEKNNQKKLRPTTLYKRMKIEKNLHAQYVWAKNDKCRTNTDEKTRQQQI